MGRLIDADRLKAHYCWWAGGSKEMSIDEAKKTFDTIIDIQPTVDAEPVRHGHWDDMGDFESCSVCHGTHLKVYQTCYGKMNWVNMSYCPHCGAKMDEVEDG